MVEGRRRCWKVVEGRGQELLVKEALPIQMPPWRSGSTEMEDRKFLVAGPQ